MNDNGVLSVVIPTYNRQDVLRRTLSGYLAQTSPNLIREIVVVDDGSTDETRSVVEQMRQLSAFPLQYCWQTNSGPAAARNRGMERVTTPLALFADDDMIPHPDLVATHARQHQQNPESSVAVLGRVKWWPELRPTPFMEWYGNAGPLFAFGQFRKNRELDFQYLYSCNLSLKTRFFTAFGRFDESFHMAAYEDTELGFRLSKAGLRLLYSPQAVAYHYQFFTFAEACRKTDRAATARERFLQTEAGSHFLERRRGRESSLARRLGRPLAAWIFRPATGLLDSRIPLPSLIYRSLFWYYTSGRATSSERIAQAARS
jgi:glycosyltransferase involved in cell wall biosynthesis